MKYPYQNPARVTWFKKEIQPSADLCDPPRHGFPTPAGGSATAAYSHKHFTQNTHQTIIMYPPVKHTPTQLNQKAPISDATQGGRMELKKPREPSPKGLPIPPQSVLTQHVTQRASLSNRFSCSYSSSLCPSWKHSPCSPPPPPALTWQRAKRQAPQLRSHQPSTQLTTLHWAPRMSQTQCWCGGKAGQASEQQNVSPEQPRPKCGLHLLSTETRLWMPTRPGDRANKRSPAPGNTCQLLWKVRKMGTKQGNNWKTKIENVCILVMFLIHKNKSRAVHRICALLQRQLKAETVSIHKTRGILVN